MEDDEVQGQTSAGRAGGVCSRLADLNNRIIVALVKTRVWFHGFKRENKAAKYIWHILSSFKSVVFSHWRFDVLGGWLPMSWCLVRQSLKLPWYSVIPYQAVLESVSKHVASFPCSGNRSCFQTWSTEVQLFPQGIQQNSQRARTNMKLKEHKCLWIGKTRIWSVSRSSRLCPVNKNTWFYPGTTPLLNVADSFLLLWTCLTRTTSCCVLQVWKTNFRKRSGT